MKRPAPDSSWAPFVDNLIGMALGALAAGLLVFTVMMHIIFPVNDREEYRFPATIGNGAYQIRVEVASPLAIDPSTQHAIVFDAQAEGK